MPITAQIFKGFDDNGWMNSKVIAIVICGYGVWILTSIKVVHFTTLSSVVITTLCGGEQYCLWNIWKTKKGFSVETYGTCLLGRSDFLCCISLWTYMAGFHPAAHGTEKYMDFGFMKSMMRSTTLPSEDMWYAGKAFNYYYGGQYFAVFLTKLTGTKVEITYNLMRTMIAAFAFVLPFSLVRQMLKDN